MTQHDAQPVPHAEPRKPKGPALLESLVALCLLLSLSGVVMPIVGEEVMAVRRGEAFGAMQDIARGLAAYSNDTLFLPTGSQGRTDVAWLYGPGELPDHIPFTGGGEGRALEDFLMTNLMGGPDWKGPYLGSLDPDPWGRAYLVNVDGWINTREEVFILSAGPDGVVQTEADDSEPRGDDLILLLD